MRFYLKSILFVVLFYSTHSANAFTLFLDNGTFFGPGNAVYNDTGIIGQNEFVDAQVKNIVLTGPLSGYIPFFNNGGLEPNAIAEKLQKGGVIDGAASDGTLINENADTALRLNFSDPKTGESADVMVIAEFSSALANGGEPIFPDKDNNLTFNPSVLADPGEPDLIARFEVSFTTGTAQVPLSLKTQNSESGGNDNAGPLPSGHRLVGRLGDFDNDGYLDGILVLGANAPLDLIVGRGDPIAQIRPWTSDIPIDPITASVLTLNGIVRNFSQVINSNFHEDNLSEIITNMHAVIENNSSVLRNLRFALLSDSLTFPAKGQIRQLRNQLQNIQHRFSYATELLERIQLRASYSLKYSKRKRRSTREFKFLPNYINDSFVNTGQVLQALSVTTGGGK